MGDRLGEEHIRLATEYGKTQLNSGHPVDSQGQPRGQGTELRTDEYGVIRARKEIIVSANYQAKAQGNALGMRVALEKIEPKWRPIEMDERNGVDTFVKAKYKDGSPNYGNTTYIRETDKPET
ncbi:hypothetical protein G7098_18785 [Leclercia adecarboxylata]|nr:hypothetical protein G7098_18785 [Leclercia adecarboxylata]